ncbi:hypothetical protein MHU86_4588 [Fragilaria crotonensis]|nr:hypothetical protein MHU86_4588 [Fragilaria crotonensis]
MFAPALSMLRSSRGVYPRVWSMSIRRLSPLSSDPEVMALREEIKALRTLMAENNHKFEILSQQVNTQSTTMERNIEDIHAKVAMMASPLEKLSALASVFVHNSETLLAFLHRFESYYKGWINKYSVSGIAVILLTIWKYRSTMYDRTSEEVAELASRTLQQEGLQRTIQETLHLVANSPETLQTLNSVLQNVLRDPLTLQELVRLVGNALEIPEVQQSLLRLLETILADDSVQQNAAEFVVKSLELDPVQELLQAQTQFLVRKIVLDKTVQQATAVGVQQSLWYTFVPSF